MKKDEQIEDVDNMIIKELDFIHEVVRGEKFDLGFRTGGVVMYKSAQSEMYSEEDLRTAIEWGMSRFGRATSKSDKDFFIQSLKKEK